jgi:hypothetical protein
MLNAAKRIVGFILLTGALFVVGLWMCSQVGYRGYTLLQYVTHNPLEPGGEYQSLRRFRELRDHRDIDIAFVGSSHGYRGFDPRIFAEAGYRTYNMSSTNQSPLNTFYLAKRYLPQLSPRLVVFEVYYPTLSNDGYESYRDLVVNTPWSWRMLQMAFATRQSSAVTYGIAKALGLTADEAVATQQPIVGESYVAGGYCETRRQRQALRPGKTFDVEVHRMQLDYLKATTAYVLSLGANVVWLTHPLPDDHLRLVANYPAIRERITQASNEAGVPYWDYNGKLALDALEHFSDFHHLNASGVARFNQALLQDLQLVLGSQ